MSHRVFLPALSSKLHFQLTEDEPGDLVVVVVVVVVVDVVVVVLDVVVAAPALSVKIT